MATEKKNLVAEEAEDKKTETSTPKEAKSQTEQEVSESVQEKPAEEKSETPPEKKPEKTESIEAKDELGPAIEEPKAETEKPELTETDSGESEVAEPEKQDYFAETRKDLPVLKPGDIIRISYRVIEGGKERIQAYEGTVIAMKNSGISKTITVRKTSFGIAVERIFPLNSKLIQKIEVKKHSKVRRAKLYYLRKLKGKAARLKELR
jgi:large subunit ribosomal protein L19